MPLALFGDLLLYFRHSPAIENKVRGRTPRAYRRFNSRRKLIYRVAHGLAEVAQFLSARSPVEGSTNISAG